MNSSRAHGLRVLLQLLGSCRGGAKTAIDTRRSDKHGYFPVLFTKAEEGFYLAMVCHIEGRASI